MKLRRLAAAAVVLVWALLLVWWLQSLARLPTPAAPQAVAELPPSAAASAPLAAAMAPMIGPPASAAGPPQPPTVKVPAKAGEGQRAGQGPAMQTGAAVWDLCGIGRVPVAASGLSSASSTQGQDLWSALPSHLGDQAFAAAMEKLAQRLDAGPPRWRAAALMLRGEDAAGGAAAPALRLLAQQADDPVLAVWALQWCGRERTCTLADVQRWLRLEPHNMAPWLEWLERAPQALDKSLQAMAQAQSFQGHETALSQVVLQALPKDVPDYLLPRVWVYAIGIEAALALPSFKALTDTCRAGLVPDSEVARACAAIARTLVERSGSLTPALIGLRLAERTYMAPAQAAGQRAALKALLMVDSGEPDLAQSLSCQAVADIRSVVEQRAQLGELGALRARAAARVASAASAASAAASAPR